MDQEEKQADNSSECASESERISGLEVNQGNHVSLGLKLSDFLPNQKPEDLREYSRRLYEIWSESASQEAGRLREENQSLRDRNTHLEKERAKLAERDRRQISSIAALEDRLQQADNRLVELDFLKKKETLYENLKETDYERRGYLMVGSILTGLGTSALGGLLTYSGGTLSKEGCIASVLMLAAGVAIFVFGYLRRFQ